ncbi:MAG: hypothetical protein EBZ60_08240 [Betaproteobacteria bacterium]|nr:hypothetical protein [Betaproteobacteria bacterium]
MWIKLFKRTPVQTIMGHRIPEPRYTWQAAFWLLLYLGMPTLLLGTLIDALIQLTTGVCTGLWCYF